MLPIPHRDGRETFIYLACPYSHPDPTIMHHRYMATNQFAALLMSQDHMVFSPLSHSHPISLCGNLPTTWEYWEKYDRKFLELSTHLYVLTLPGWETSIGVKAEIEIAQELGIDIHYIFGLVPTQKQLASDASPEEMLENSKGLDPRLIDPEYTKTLG